MVKNRSLFAASAILIIFLASASRASAQRVYLINHEWVEILINQNGTIDLFYNISIALSSGPDINHIYVGQPKSDFTIGKAIDQYGRILKVAPRVEEGEYQVDVTLASPLKAGQTFWFALVTNVAHMIYEDTETNAGMQFTPTWWSGASVLNLRILVVLPPDIVASQVNTTSTLWNGTRYQDGRLAIYWEQHTLPPDARFSVGVSYPKPEGWQYETQPSGWEAFYINYGPALMLLGFLALVLVGIGVAIRKRPYLLPRISMETLGTRRGFTAVEASCLLNLPPTKIVTEILYSLLHKRAIWVESTSPSLRLRIMPDFQNRTGTAEIPLRYYEIDFLQAVNEDGTLEEERLAKAISFLRAEVEEKMRGYCRRDTTDYYKSIVAKAWEQVEQAGTPELASRVYDEQLLWLLLDPEPKTRTESAFRDRVFEPSPLWFWYWYGYHHYHPQPAYVPNVDTPANSGKPPTIPGADLANNIATAVEKTSSNFVASVEKFADALVPVSASGKTSSTPARSGASCVCACAACACACACVSCACACAGGGVG